MTRARRARLYLELYWRAWHTYYMAGFAAVLLCQLLFLTVFDF